VRIGSTAWENDATATAPETAKDMAQKEKEIDR
jgi:hypothetical protein